MLSVYPRTITCTYLVYKIRDTTVLYCSIDYDGYSRAILEEFEDCDWSKEIYYNSYSDFTNQLVYSEKNKLNSDMTIAFLQLENLV